MMDYRIIFLPDFDKDIIDIMLTIGRPVTVTEIMDIIFENETPESYDYHNKRSLIYRHLTSLHKNGIVSKTQVHENNFTKDYALFDFIPLEAEE